MTINERFKTLRDRLKISQNEMAQKIGTDQASVSKIENGKLNLTVENIQNLHSGYGINLNWLMCGEGKMKDDFTTYSEVNEPKAAYGEKHSDYLIELQKEMIEKLKIENEELRKRLEEKSANGVRNGIQK